MSDDTYVQLHRCKGRGTGAERFRGLSKCAYCTDGERIKCGFIGTVPVGFLSINS